MNLRDFKYLIALADEKSFKKAANICNCTQPTLSMQIKKLEEYLQVQIFERTNKAVNLTPIGQEIYYKAKELGRIEADILDIAKNNQNPFEGELKIGAFPTLAPYYFPDLVPKITKKFKDLELFLVEEKTEILISQLEAGDIDLALLALPVKNNNFKFEKIFEEEFLLAAPNSHPIAQMKKVKATDIEKEKLLLLEEGHCLRDQALDFCDMANVEENNKFRATSLETVRNMVLAGMGITIIPKLAARKVSGIKYLQIDEKTNSYREIGLFWRKGTYREELFKEIAKVIG